MKWPVQLSFLAYRSARASLTILSSIAFLCLFGPLLSGHPYDQVYRDLVPVRPALIAHPTASETRESLETTVRRMHVEFAAQREVGGALQVTLKSSKPLDPRALRVFERSDGSVAGYAGGRVDALMMR